MNHLAKRESAVAITRLDNGFTVATQTMPEVFTANLGVWVGAGSRHEEMHEHGLSHLIEHMAFKGTARRSARRIAEDIENVGGEINAATSVEYTSYSARVLGEHVNVAVDVLGDIVTNSVFEAQELAREKAVILQEYAAVEDTPDDLIYDTFMETAFSGQPIGRPILGTPQTLAHLHADTIQAFLAREYTPQRIVLSAVGHVDHERVVDLAQRAFGHMKAEAISTPAAGLYSGGEKRISRKLEQASLAIGFPGVSFKDPDYFALNLFAQILGGGLTSRLWQEVRETRGLAYSVEAFLWPFSDCGLFGISAGTAGKDVGDLVSVSLETLAGAMDTIEQPELDRARAQTKVALLASLESTGGRVERIGRQLLSWGHLIPHEEVLRRIDAVGIDDVRRAARMLLQERPTLVGIGPIKGLPRLAKVVEALQKQGLTSPALP